jgi:polyhydroxybutyrate depolymerase
VTKPAASVRSTAYGRCRGGAEVVLVAIAGAGHTWPGGPPLPARILRLLGPQSHAVDADTLLWRFFSAHRLR